MSTWTINPNEFDLYRERHGSDSLMLHVGRGKVFVCKRHDADSATLVEVRSHAEVTMTAKEFKAEFKLCFVDEANLYCGSPEDKASAQRQIDAQAAAVRYCIEQDRAVSA
ncbi:MAG: hypothetical protein O9327_03275 [Polaromonas sp.]|nr:hypothetical protein [Polaromonas sp.]